MNRVTPQMQDLASRLMAHEIGGSQSAQTTKLVALHAYEKLRPQLELLAGKAGFRAILTRALALARPQVPWLRAVQMQPDGTLMGLDELEAQVEPKEMVEGGVILLAQLFGLLVAFIGEDLTLRIAREAWTELPLKDFSFAGG